MATEARCKHGCLCGHQQERKATKHGIVCAKCSKPVYILRKVTTGYEWVRAK